MTSRRHTYRVIETGNLGEVILQLNTLFVLLQDRLDKMEGLRGTAELFSTLEMNENLVSEVADPVSAQDAVTKNYLGTTPARDDMGTLDVAHGGTGVTSLTDGGIMLGSGTDPVTVMSVLADGSIVVGDGATDPVALAAFTSSTGTLKHESGGLEADISAIADGDFIVGTGAGTLGLESGATARTSIGLGTADTPQFAREGLGEAAHATDILSITSASSTDTSKGMDIIHSGAITGTGYAGYFAKTGASTNNVAIYCSASGATNNYGLIVGAGDVGIGTTAPVTSLQIVNNNETTTQTEVTQALTKSGIHLVTEYTADAFTPGLFWSTSNNNSTKPKGGVYLKETVSGTYMYLGTSNLYTTGIVENVVIDFQGYIGIGTGTPETAIEAEEEETITGAVADGYAASITIDPGYTAATAQTVTRHNYIDLQNPSLSGAGPAALMDAAVMRFDDTVANHQALEANGAVAVTITSLGPTGSQTTIQGWMKVNINGTLRYIPFW